MTSDVLLRDLQAEDLPLFYEHQREPEALQMTAFPTRDWDAFMAHWAKNMANPAAIHRTIVWDGQVVGNIVSFAQDGEREVGYWLGKAFWGQGIASRALAAFLGLEKTRPLYAHVAQHNIASRRVLEKCGFKVVGEDRWQPDPGGAVIAEYILILEA